MGSSSLSCISSPELCGRRRPGLRIFGAVNLFGRQTGFRQYYQFGIRATSVKSRIGIG
jgi:hypothetical protein